MLANTKSGCSVNLIYTANALHDSEYTYKLASILDFAL